MGKADLAASGLANKGNSGSWSVESTDQAGSGVGLIQRSHFFLLVLESIFQGNLIVIWPMLLRGFQLDLFLWQGHAQPVAAQIMSEMQIWFILKPQICQIDLNNEKKAIVHGVFVTSF